MSCLTGVLVIDVEPQELLDSLVRSHAALHEALDGGRPAGPGRAHDLIVSRCQLPDRPFPPAPAAWADLPFEVKYLRQPLGDLLTGGKLSLLAGAVAFILYGAVLLHDRPLTAAASRRIVALLRDWEFEKVALWCAKPSRDDRAVHYAVVPVSDHLAVHGLVNVDYDVLRPRPRGILGFPRYRLERCGKGPTTFAEMIHGLKFSALRNNLPVMDIRID